MMKRLILTMMLLFALCSTASGTNYYMKPLGNDGNTGLTGALAWQTLQRARSTLVAGDTLFIMGGNYTTAQYLHDETGTFGGTPPRPIVLRAYGDSKAYFQNYTSPSGYYRFLRLYGDHGLNWGHIVVDGTSALHPADTTTRYLVLLGQNLSAANDDQSYLIQCEITNGSGSHRIKGITLRNLVLDGDSLCSWYGAGSTGTPNPLAPNGAHGHLLHCLSLTGVDTFDVNNCDIHHAFYPTGPTAPGNNTNGDQSECDAVVLRSVKHGFVRNSTIKDANHGLVLMIRFQWRESSYGDAAYDSVCKYVVFKNNTFDQHWGGGLYLNSQTQYCLVEGNTFLHGGGTADNGKPPIQISGPHNTVRQNVFYWPLNQGVVVNAQYQVNDAYAPAYCDYTYFYNNTLYNCKWYNMALNVTGDASVCSIENSVFSNNIFLNALGPKTMEGTGYQYDIEMWISTYWALATHNWITPDTYNCTSGYKGLGVWPSSTGWGANAFKNNLFRHGLRGVANDSIVLYQRDVDICGTYTEFTSMTRLDSLNCDFSADARANYGGGDGAWANNISGDPLLTSANPDAYGIGWWYLQAGSPAIDAGVEIVDPNAAYMQAHHAAYAWDTLAHSGAAPDIGAYEVTGAEDTCSITVTHPMPPDDIIWNEGSVHNITWTPSHTATNVRLTLYMEGIGPEGIPGAWHLITSSTNAAAGTYAWTVGGQSSDPGWEYYVKVTNLGAGGDTTCANFSGPVFISPLPLCTIALTSPTYGVSWIVGSSHAITWTAANAGTYSKLELFKAGVFEGTISSSSANATGSYTWTVEKFGAADGADYTVVATDLTYSACKDTSAAFSIVGVTSCGVSVSSLSFGNIATGDSTATQSFTITNTGDITINGNVSDSSPDFDIITGGGPYTLTTHQIKSVTVRFQPLTGGAKSATIETGMDACADVVCTGGALSVSPSTIAFSATNVGECSDPSTITITNSGSGTIAGTIFEACNDFEIISGGGSYSLTAGASRVIYVKFCPLSGGTKTCSINY